VAEGGVAFLLDENMPPRLARALRELGENAFHVVDVLHRGVPDEIVLRYAGDRGWCLVSRDRNILRRPQQRAVLTELGVGAFFVKEGIDEMFHIARVVINAWPEMRRIAAREEKPFFYLVKERSVVRITRRR
jgi:hypothetical protein